MTAMTESSEEALKFAIKAVDETNQLVERLNDRVQNAQKRVNETKNFVAAAELEYQNADAKFLVLKELLEKQDLLEDKLADAEEELSQAKEIEKSVTRTRAALEKVTGAAQRFVNSAETAVTGLAELTQKLDADADKAEEGHKAPLRNAARSVSGLHTKLATEHRTLQSELDTARRDYDAVPEITGVAELQEKVTRLKQELRSVKAEHKGKHPAVSSADLEKAEAGRGNARLILDQAPEAELAAQADLRAKQAELDDAENGHAKAVNAFEQVEQQFIAQIVVSDPDPTGWAIARAYLTQNIPGGYVVRWQAGGAPMKPETGIGVLSRPDPGAPPVVTISIDANALPVGNTQIEATIEKLTEPA
jgi:chromosome segregation ATPase